MAFFGINQYLLINYEKNAAPSFFQTRQISLKINLVWVRKEMSLSPQKLWMGSASQQEHTREDTWMEDRTLSWRTVKWGRTLHSRENATEGTETEVFEIMGSERDMDGDPITPNPSGGGMQEAQKRQEKVALGTTAPWLSPWHSHTCPTVCFSWDKWIYGNKTHQGLLNTTYDLLLPSAHMES